jgi:hypothetical protein
MFSLEVLAILLFYIGTSGAQTLGSCTRPDDIQSSRSIRLHHPCESNQNRWFAIELKNDSLCIFYSVDDISIFGAETKFEIKVDGNWDFEQVRPKSYEIR